MSYLPISELSAYGRKEWTIKARVSTRGRMREFSRNTGDKNYVLNVDLIDEHGSEIRASLWGKMAQDHDATLKAGNVYILSNGSVKLANKKFSSCNHNYELSFDERKGSISLVEDDAKIQQIKYRFVELRKVREMTPPCTVDLCVAVKEMQPVREIKGGLWMRKCAVVDASLNSIELAVFDDAEKAEDLTGHVLTLKAVSVKEFNGLSASVSGANVKANLAIPEVATLQAWWEQTGKTSHVSAMSNTGATGGKDVTVQEGSLAELKEAAEQLQGDKPLFWNVAHPVCLAYVRAKTKEGAPQRVTYDACPECKKKVECDAQGKGHCMKCNKEVDTTPRLMVSSAKIEDNCSEQWLGLFDQGGSQLLGMDGKAAKRLEADPAALDAELKSRYFATRFSCKLRAKLEVYNGEPKVRTSLVGAEKYDEVEGSRKMLAQIEGLYDAASSADQAAIKETLAFIQGLDGGARPQAWQADITRLAARVA